MTAAAGGPLLDVDRVTLRYVAHDREVTATEGVGFQVRHGDRMVLLGPSGCGKSTLLKAVGGYLKPSEGSISLNGRPVAGPGPDRVMVFQEFDQLLPWKTVRENVAFGLTASKSLPKREATARAEEALRKVRLENFAGAYPHTLSGGMKQRVAIARCLAMKPEIILMDEPFAALDALSRRRMQDELLELWDEARLAAAIYSCAHWVRFSIFFRSTRSTGWPNFVVSDDFTSTKAIKSSLRTIRSISLCPLRQLRSRITKPCSV